MICRNCKEEISCITMHFAWDSSNECYDYVCSPKAERSEALPGCPPSATGCPDARAVGQVGADGSGRCPEESGPKLAAQSLVRFVAEESQVAVDALNLLDFHEGDLRKRNIIERAMFKAIGRYLEASGAPQRSGERALPGNVRLTDGENPNQTTR